MKIRLWLCAIGLLAGLLSLAWRTTPSRAAVTVDGNTPNSGGPIIAKSPLRLMGAGSCAAAACHNANFAHGPTGSEYTQWVTRDPHARAYAVLFDDLAVNINKNLQSTTDPHRDCRCLNCHVMPNLDGYVERQVAYLRAKKVQNIDPAAIKATYAADGVSCEACHGPAEKWLSLHVLPEWKEKDDEKKESYGMTNSRSVSGRAKVCVDCHVGKPGMDVDHDLIAAGHPRLSFEFAAFHSALPRHWPDAKDRNPTPTKTSRGRADFEGRAWIAGQVVSAQAALELLAARAEEKHGVWPEFAEHDCASCHHSLENRYAPGNLKDNSIPWSGWYLSMTPHALPRIKPDAITPKSMTGNWRVRGNISEQARTAMQGFKHSLSPAVFDGHLNDPRWVHELFRKLLSEDKAAVGSSWDEKIPRYLALAAMWQSASDMKSPLPADLRQAAQRHFLGHPEYPWECKKMPPVPVPEAVGKRLLEFKLSIQ